ncbi:hypothetical protein ACFY0F_07905 [Streptomyces sp. NPDC001544]
MYAMIIVIVLVLVVAGVTGARATGRRPQPDTGTDRIQRVMRSPHH